MTTTNTPSTFYMRDGMLSAYGLACGYFDKAHVGSAKVELFRTGLLYNVRAFAYDHRMATPLAWVSTYSLTDARRQFRALRRMVNTRKGW